MTTTSKSPTQKGWNWALLVLKVAAIKLLSLKNTLKSCAHLRRIFFTHKFVAQSIEEMNLYSNNFWFSFYFYGQS